MKKKFVRILAGFLSVLAVFCMMIPAFADETPQDTETTQWSKADYYSRLADMNEDWMLNSADARVILRLSARIDWVKDPGWLPKGEVFGDIDENGVVNSVDARWTLRVSARLNSVPEVIRLQAEQPNNPTRPTETAPTTAAPTTTPPTTVPPVTNGPDYVELPLCDEYLLEMKAGENESYLIATDGLSFYIKSADIAGGLAVFIDRDGNAYLLNDADKEYAKFRADTMKSIGAEIKKVRSFAVGLFVPGLFELDSYSDYTVSTELVDLISYTVAQKGSTKIYYYGDGSIMKISAKNYGGTQKDFEVVRAEMSAESYLNILSDYQELNTNRFILKNGLDFLSALL